MGEQCLWRTPLQQPQTFYVDAEDALQAIRTGAPFHTIHIPTVMKFDLFPAAVFLLDVLCFQCYIFHVERISMNRPDVLEIPFASVTLLDSTLKARIPAVRKYRQGLHRTLNRGVQVSVGRAGTIHLNALPVIHCTAVAARWRPAEAKQLEEAYRSAGLARLMASSRYGAALERAGNSLRGAGITTGANAAKQISRRIGELTMADKVVQDVALRMGDIFRKVDDRLGEMRRFSGHVVRYEGARALVTVNTGEREELRVADRHYLEAMGLQDTGAPFLLHEFKWSPDSTMSLYIPAVDLGGDLAAGLASEQQLKDAEQSLPEPPEISLD